VEADRIASGQIESIQNARRILQNQLDNARTTEGGKLQNLLHKMTQMADETKEIIDAESDDEMVTFCNCFLYILYRVFCGVDFFTCYLGLVT
jgi:hypothetical protein